MTNKIKIALGVFALFPTFANADALDDKIAELTRQKLDKIAQLEQCQKSTKGLKIAGITTLGISAIGIGANIGEAIKIKKLDSELSTIATKKTDLQNKIDAAKKEQEKAKKSAQQLPQNQLQQLSQNVIPECGEQTCAEWSDEQLLALNVTDGICVSGVRKPVECYSGNPVGVAVQCKQGNEIITYYDSCQTVEEVTPENKVRKYHEDCSAAETANIPYAKTSWWYVDKCVPKSCQDNAYLTVKNGSSQGICRTICPEHQIIDWSNGGKACDIAKKEKVTPPQNCTRTEIAITNYKTGICDTECNEYATTNNCTVTKSIFMLNKNKCICNPTLQDEMINASEFHNKKSDVSLSDCPEKLYQRINPRQCESLCAKYATDNNCKITKFGTVLTYNCYCNPSSTVTLD
ncbi:MAG: hypothetical protein R8N24_02105 [Alphaproteobacteria bacterium]|nr:hypothetical protein [Alphaproteobacteria bacterium]